MAIDGRARLEEGRFSYGSLQLCGRDMGEPAEPSFENPGEHHGRYPSTAGRLQLNDKGHHVQVYIKAASGYLQAAKVELAQRGRQL